MSTPWTLAIWQETDYGDGWEGTYETPHVNKLTAYPDPDFLDDWEGTGSPPPQPENIVMSVIDSNIPESMYEVSGNELRINIDDMGMLFELESIKYELNDEVYSANMLYDLYQSGFDFVFEFVPYTDERIYKFIRYKATSTSQETLYGEYGIFSVSTFDQTKEKLQDVLNDGSDFLNNISEGDGSASQTEPPEPPSNSDTVVKPEFKSEFVPLKEKFGIKDDEE